MTNPGLDARFTAGFVPANRVFSLEHGVTKGDVARGVLLARRQARSEAIGELTGVKPAIERIPFPDQLDPKLRESVWGLEELGHQIARERERLTAQGADLGVGMKRFILALPDGGKAAEAAILEVGTNPVVNKMRQQDLAFAEAVDDAMREVIYARHSG
jgi:hypothetical protein